MEIICLLATSLFQEVISQLGSSEHVKHFPGDKLTDPSDITRGQGNNVLHVAAKYKKSTDVETILESHSELAHETNAKGDTPLHIASRLGKLDVAECLIKYAERPAGEAEDGRPLQVENNRRNTALHEAVEAKLRKLLQAKNNRRNTALYEAVLNGHYDIANLLIEKDRTLTSFDNEEGESPLFLAVDRGHDKIALRILENFQAGNCSFSGSNGMTVMHVAVIRTRPHFREKQFAFALTLVFASTWAISPTLMIYLMSHLLMSILMVGSYNYILITKEQFLSLFLQDNFVGKVITTWGSEILEIPDDFGWMPHHYAANLGISRILKLILETNSSLAYIQDKEGMSALHISARNGHVDVIKTVIRECPDVCELLDKKERTALHVAVQHKQVFALHALLKTIAFDDLINEQDFEGNTALHLACINGDYETIIPLLSDRRTNKRTINKKGLTAFDIMNKSSILGPFFKFMIKSQWRIKNSSSLQEAAAVGYTEEKQEATSPETNQPTMSVPNFNNASFGKEKRDKDKSVKHTADINLLVATIIASITFTAAMTMPGGYNDSNGLAKLRERTSFRYFLAFDSLAFGCSAASMVMHFAVTVQSKLRGKAYKYPIHLTTLLTFLSIISTVLAFIMGTYTVLYENKSVPNSKSGFGLPGNIAFAAFFLTLLSFFLPLLVAFYAFSTSIPYSNVKLLMIRLSNLPIIRLAKNRNRQYLEQRNDSV